MFKPYTIILLIPLTHPLPYTFSTTPEIVLCPHHYTRNVLPPRNAMCNDKGQLVTFDQIYWQYILFRCWKLLRHSSPHNDLPLLRPRCLTMTRHRYQQWGSVGIFWSYFIQKIIFLIIPSHHYTRAVLPPHNTYRNNGGQLVTFDHIPCQNIFFHCLQ